MIYLLVVIFLLRNPNLPLKVAFTIETEEYYGIAVKKGNTELVEKINNALIQLKEEASMLSSTKNGLKRSRLLTSRKQIVLYLYNAGA